MNNGTQLENLIKGALSYEEDTIIPSDTSFEKVKIALEMNRKHGSNMLRNPIITRKSFLWAIIFAFAFVITGGAIGVSAVTLLKSDKTGNSDKTIKVDNTDYPFVDDPHAIGKWESVDYVNSIDEFSPDKKFWTGGLYLKEQVFIKDGKMLVSVGEGNGNLAPSPTKWTKELIINKYQKTASKYKIMDIDGSTYMFFEWKSGDYTYRGMQPRLYVLKKVDNVDYTNFEIPRIKDETDYPFANDRQVVGTWESVDFVRTIESFNPDVKNCLSDDLFVTSLVFEGNGQMTMNIMEADKPDNTLNWTKGIILDKSGQTASKYEIRKINGSSYLFFEWKSGDYVYRGMQPYFYVLKKVD